MKKILIFLFILFSFMSEVSANEAINYVHNELKALDGYAGEFSFYEFSKALEDGQADLSDMGLIKKIGVVLSDEIYKDIKVILGLLVPVILFSMMSNLSLSRTNSVVHTAQLIMYVMIAMTAFYVFNDMLKVAQSALVEISAVTKCIIPVLFSLYACLGNTVSATILKPSVFITSQLFCDVIMKFFFPLTTLSFALTLTDNILGTTRLKYFGDMIGKFIKWSMVFSVTVYMTFVATANIAGGALKGLQLKSAKFAVATFVPVVGGVLAEGVEAAAASFKLIKSSVGIAGVVGVIYMAVIPVIKIFTVVLFFKILAVFTEPLGEQKLSELASSIGGTIGLMGTMVVCVVFIFLIFTAVVISGG